jgi:hypothetical protein
MTWVINSCYLLVMLCHSRVLHMPVPSKLVHNCFVVTRSWNLYVFLPSMFWLWPCIVQAVVHNALLGVIRMTASLRRRDFPIEWLLPKHGLHWPCEALSVLQRHLHPISRPSVYPVPSSWMATPRTRIPAGRASHGAPPVDLVSCLSGQSGCHDGGSWRRRPSGMATGGTEDGLVVAWPRSCCQQQRPRPTTGHGHVPDSAAHDAIHHSITLLPPPSRCQWAPFTAPCIPSKSHSFYHVECVISINHKWIPCAIEPRRSRVCLDY